MIVNVLVLFVAILVLGVMLWKFSLSNITVKPEECVNVNMAPSFSYDSCYDAYSGNIFLEVKRGVDDYSINFLKVSFFDFNMQSYKLVDVPVVGRSQAYKIPAGKNPQNLDIVLDVVRDFSAPVCDEAKKVFVKYCPVRAGGNFNVSVSPLEGVNTGDYIEVPRNTLPSSDVLDLSLVDKERIWESSCKSNWRCEEWEGCVDGVQRRTCEDFSECSVSTNIPIRVRYCDETCVENWECEWSECNGGYTVPNCRDLNDCGTLYNVPRKLECNLETESGCIPNVECGEWTSCEVDYSFIDLTDGKINNLDGIKHRICEDKNACVGSREETRKCSVNVDIYTKKFVQCGTEFVGIYDRLTNGLIARVEEGVGKDEPYVNIYFGERKGDVVYCDYCYDGVLNGDEIGIDCGGGCMSCEEKYVTSSFVVDSWWDKFLNWLSGLF